MKKILAMVLALALILSVAAASAELKTIEEGKPKADSDDWDKTE